MHIDDAALDAAMGRLAKQQFSRMGVRDAVELVVRSMPTLFSADGAGLLLLDDTQDLRHVASTDEGAHILEAVQETAGRGPCVSSLVDGEVVVVKDICTDERWPELRPVLVENGIRAIIGAPVHVAETPIGSLNVYRRDVYGWDRSDVAALLGFNQLLERVLANAVLNAKNEALVNQLELALSARVDIDRAVGLVMGVYDLEAAEAFERIRRSARASRRPVRELAQEILSTRKLP